MHKDIVKAYRNMIIEGLSKCTVDQIHLFKRMYSPMNLTLPIEEVVMNIPIDKLDWSLTQVTNTLDKRPAIEQLK